ncbi:energy transducer TonB family protein [Phreatobacter oligotrophus]|uniref:Protein TonB n=1 Tax=Phreatobacter oligotrophus TaxID=1122261 RepID=A0A2T4YWN5_9HYPH|nr:energy transducer TonB [Phreatobacter oligotrophus]PTM49071.1 protein TonB [Phreatobacter oligotrophus]
MRLDTDIAVLDAPAPQGVAVPAVRVAAESVAGAVAPAVAALAAAPSAETAPLPVVPEGTAVTVASRWRLLLGVTAIASVALHGVVIAAFMTMTTTPPQRADMPAVEVEMVEADAEPPPAAAAAASEAMPVEQPPDTASAEIALPPMEEIPLPADLMPPPVAEAPPPPVEVAEAPPPRQPPEPAVERPIVIEPPPELPALSAELTPPPPLPVAVPTPAPPIVQPRREPPRPVVRRQEPREQPPRERVARPAPPRPPSPPSSASEGRGVTSRATPRTSSPPPSYLALVMAQLHRAKPASAGQTGRAVVRFSILRSGAAGGVSLASSSGNSVVDQAAVAMVRRAAPFPPLPAEYGPAAMPLTVPVAFR